MTPAFKNEIQAEEFENYQMLILRGQIPQQDVPELLEANPNFSEWYRQQLRQISTEGAKPDTTPEMVQAGLDAWDYMQRQGQPRNMIVKTIFEAMLLAQNSDNE